MTRTRFQLVHIDNLNLVSLIASHSSESFLHMSHTVFISFQSLGGGSVIILKSIICYQMRLGVCESSFRLVQQKLHPIDHKETSVHAFFYMNIYISKLIALLSVSVFLNYFLLSRIVNIQIKFWNFLWLSYCENIDINWRENNFMFLFPIN